MSKMKTSETAADPWSLKFEQGLERIRQIHYAKRNDYTGGKHPLENYNRSAEVIGVTPEQIMLARVQEKVTRVGNLLRGTNQQVKDEAVEDSLLDIANIALLILTSLACRRVLADGSPT